MIYLNDAGEQTAWCVKTSRRECAEDATFKVRNTTDGTEITVPATIIDDGALFVGFTFEIEDLVEGSYEYELRDSAGVVSAGCAIVPIISTTLEHDTKIEYKQYGE